MSESAEELKSKLSDLPARERAELAYFLIDSLDAEVDPDWESSWNEELRRREAEINARQDTGESADKVFTELRKKHA
jgi:putative addiction module component (TIGR02574 family)